MIKTCRAPHGARGLKCLQSKTLPRIKASRPARGAWIEMPFPAPGTTGITSRAPHGARGLKWCVLFRQRPALRVAPRTGRVD